MYTLQKAGRTLLEEAAGTPLHRSPQLSDLLERMLTFNPAKRITLEQVQERTGFKLLFDDEIESLEPPTRDELTILREFDPERIYID